MMQLWFRLVPEPRSELARYAGHSRAVSIAAMSEPFRTCRVPAKASGYGSQPDALSAKTRPAGGGSSPNASMMGPPPNAAGGRYDWSASFIISDWRLAGGPPPVSPSG